jgi:hypothetical protein
MEISRITAQDATGTSSETYPGATTSGNLLIAVVSDTDGVTDTIAITGFTTAISTGTSSNQISILYKIANGTESVITPTAGVGTFLTGIYEYTGNTATPFDKSASNATNLTTSLSVSTGTTATTTNANEVAIGAVYWETGVQTFSSATNSFNIVSSIGTHLFVVDSILSSKATYQTTITVTGTSDIYSAVIATFMAPVEPSFVKIPANINGGAKIRPHAFSPGLAR